MGGLGCPCGFLIGLTRRGEGTFEIGLPIWCGVIRREKEKIRIIDIHGFMVMAPVAFAVVGLRLLTSLWFLCIIYCFGSEKMEFLLKYFTSKWNSFYNNTT